MLSDCHKSTYGMSHVKCYIKCHNVVNYMYTTIQNTKKRYYTNVINNNRKHILQISYPLIYTNRTCDTPNN